MTFSNHRYCSPHWRGKLIQAERNVKLGFTKSVERIWWLPWRQPNMLQSRGTWAWCRSRGSCHPDPRHQGWSSPREWARPSHSHQSLWRQCSRTWGSRRWRGWECRWRLRPRLHRQWSEGSSWCSPGGPGSKRISCWPPIPPERWATTVPDLTLLGPPRPRSCRGCSGRNRTRRWGWCRCRASPPPRITPRSWRIHRRKDNRTGSSSCKIERVSPATIPKVWLRIFNVWKLMV